MMITEYLSFPLRRSYRHGSGDRVGLACPVTGTVDGVQDFVSSMVRLETLGILMSGYGIGFAYQYPAISSLDQSGSLISPRGSNPVM